MSDDKKKKRGYTSVTLGDVLDKVDKQSECTGINNRTLVIRMILTKYYALKEKGVDILKLDVEDIVRELKK